MGEVSLLRLYVLRAGYLLIVVGLALMIWPGIVSHGDDVPHMNTAVRSLLGGVSILALIGLRHPLKMLPVLLFELIWKLIWVLAFGLPLWAKQLLTGDFAETMFECIFGIIVVLIVVPWPYVFRHYVKAPGERWRGANP
jgi:hypothetical protein